MLYLLFWNKEKVIKVNRSESYGSCLVTLKLSFFNEKFGVEIIIKMLKTKYILMGNPFLIRLQNKQRHKWLIPVNTFN